MQIYANPKEPSEERQDNAFKDFRELSSKLQSVMCLVPMYRFTSKVFGLPSRENIVEVSKSLIGLHNGHDGALDNQGILNMYSAWDIRVSLGLYIPEGERLNPANKPKFIKAKKLTSKTRGINFPLRYNFIGVAGVIFTAIPISI